MRFKSLEIIFCERQITENDNSDSQKCLTTKIIFHIQQAKLQLSFVRHIEQKSSEHIGNVNFKLKKKLIRIFGCKEKKNGEGKSR